MPERARRESPLARFALASRRGAETSAAGIIASERAFLGHVNVRGDAGDARFVAAVRAAAGVEPPVVPNTTRSAAATTVYWLGPDEWLVVTDGERELAMATQLQAALEGMHAAVTVVGGGQTTIVLRGNAVRELLSQECPLDLHPRSFEPGACAQSRLAKAPVLLRLAEDGASFEVIVRRSYADYLWSWLEDAAAEYGLAVTGEA